MLVLSSPLAPALLSPATPVGGAELSAPGSTATITSRPISSIENSSADNTNDGDQRPTGQPGRSLAALDIQTQNAAQSTEETPETGETPAVDDAASVDNESPAGDTAAAPDEANEDETSTNQNGEKVDANGLTEQENRKVEQLKQRDREVKEHERAHAAAGSGIAGQPSFKFTTGPDGKQYAVAGEVQIDTSPVRGNPQATIRKLEQVKRAALAPSSPSAQDRRVAARAEASITAARQELAELKRQELEQNGGSSERIAATTASDRAARNSGGQEPVFDPEKRFRNKVEGIGEAPGTGLAGAGALLTNVGLSDPGALFNLVA
jgi:hypothetical protein